MNSIKCAALLAGIAVATTPLLPTQNLAAQSAERPWMTAALEAEKRAELILAAMTLDEKVALLHGPMGMSFGPGGLPPGAIGSAGYIAGNERLGIPALQESDASLGVTNPMLVRGAADMSTALPSSLALAATRLLAEYDVARRGWVIAPGIYEVAIGTDAGTMALGGSARLSGQALRP